MINWSIREIEVFLALAQGSVEAGLARITPMALAALSLMMSVVVAAVTFLAQARGKGWSNERIRDLVLRPDERAWLAAVDWGSACARGAAVASARSARRMARKVACRMLIVSISSTLASATLQHSARARISS